MLVNIFFKIFSQFFEIRVKCPFKAFFCNLFISIKVEAEALPHSRRKQGGWRGGRPPFGSKRRQLGQIVYLFGRTSGEKPS